MSAALIAGEQIGRPLGNTPTMPESGVSFGIPKVNTEGSRQFIQGCRRKNTAIPPPRVAIWGMRLAMTQILEAIQRRLNGGAGADQSIGRAWV